MGAMRVGSFFTSYSCLSPLALCMRAMEDGFFAFRATA